MPGDAAQSHSLNYVIPQRRLQCTQRAAVQAEWNLQKRCEAELANSPQAQSKQDAVHRIEDLK